MLTILHGGYNNVSRRELDRVELKVPENAGSRWMGVAHGKLVDGLVTTLHDYYGMAPVPGTEQYAVSPNGAALVGGFALGTPIKRGRKKPTIETLKFPWDGDGGGPDAGSIDSFTRAIGFYHSNDLKRALTICGGGHVFLCNNGMVLASHRMRRKHTTGLTLMDWLSEGLKPMLDAQNESIQQVAALYDREVRAKDHDNMLLKFGRAGILSWHHVGVLDNDWKTAKDSGGEVLPWMEDDMQKAGGNEDWGFSSNAWDWYNMVTHVAKRVPPINQFQTLERAYHATCGLLPKDLRPEPVVSTAP